MSSTSEQEQKQKQQQERKPQPRIIQEYKELAQVKIVDFKRFFKKGLETRIFVLSKDITNALQIEEKQRHYLMIKKRWLPYKIWSDERIPSCEGEKGHTISADAFYWMEKIKNRTVRVVFYMTEEDKFYITNFGILSDFVYRKSSWFTDNYGNEVIGFSKDIFSDNRLDF